MLPLLLLLVFSCPVKRALNPFLIPTSNSEKMDDGLFKVTKSLVFLYYSPCSPTSYNIEKQAITYQKENHLHLQVPVLLLAFDRAEMFLLPEKESFSDTRPDLSLYSSVPVFLRNRVFLI